MTINPFETKEQALKYIVNAIRKCTGENLYGVGESSLNSFKLRLRMYVGDLFPFIVDTLFDNNIKVFGGGYKSIDILDTFQSRIDENGIIGDVEYKQILTLFVYAFSDEDQ